jgi:hypothetical protein
MKIDMYNMDMAIDMGIHALYKTPVQRIGSRLLDIDKNFNLISEIVLDSAVFKPEIGGSNIMLRLISFITDIGLSVDLQYDHVYPSCCGELATPLVTV